MSGIFGASTKWLSGVLTGTIPTPGNWTLIVGWYKHTAGGTINGFVCELKSPTETNYIRIGVTASGPILSAFGRWMSTSQTAQQASNLTNDVWRLAGGLLPPDDGAFHNVKGWDNGNTDTSSMATPNTATENLTTFEIGQGGNINAFSYWEGRVAEFAIFTVANETEADTIMTALATQTADAITLPAGSTLIAYYPLLSNATATTGPALTDHGTVAFDGADHPSLSGGGGGGSTFCRIVGSRFSLVGPGGLAG